MTMFSQLPWATVLRVFDLYLLEVSKTALQIRFPQLFFPSFLPGKDVTVSIWIFDLGRASARTSRAGLN
jgi:hypothetical protein